MKKLTLSLLIALIFYEIFGCTSFAVFSSETWYGMNFDYPETDIRYFMDEMGERQVFAMGFEDYNGSYVRTVGMNNEGMFCSIQMFYPEQPGSQPSGDEMYIGDIFYHYLYSFNNVQDFVNHITGLDLHHYSNISLHAFIADRNGNACVIEQKNGEEMITMMENDFQVMTNFCNGDYCDVDYTQVNGVGDTRYIAAYENVLNNYDNFSLQDGLNTLELSMQATGSYKSLTSLVFDPIELDVYIVAERDFEKIWKMSFEDRTITPHSGFTSHTSFDIFDSGVSMQELIDYATIDNIEEQRKYNFKIYPNPAESFINIEFPYVNKQITLIIYNVLGKEILKQELFYVNEKIELDVTSLKRGNYLIKVDSDLHSQTQKMIKL